MSDIEFRLLGPLDVRAAGVAVRIGGARQRILLSMLLLESGQVLPLERLIDAVWDNTPPATARTQIQIGVSELRRRLDGLGDSDLIITSPPGYLIQVPDEAIDVIRFRRLVAGGREAARRRDNAVAASGLRAALELWRGEAASGLASRLVQAAALRLNEERLAVLEECLGLELELGRHHELVGELRALVSAHPFREKLYAHLMVALYRDGRHAEALAEYRAAHRMLVEGHGIDPGDELRALERAILDNDPGLGLPASDPGPIAPSQLPAAVPDFVGRDEMVAQMRRHLTADRAAGTAGQHVQVVVASGPGGSGKTTLALQVAHSVREHLPDGQLFARLRGADARPVHPEQVLDQFLRALGVPPPMLPSGVDELAAVYRSRTAGRRVLVVLDDAKDAEQVLPLIPGDPQCAVLLTSRSPLPGLPGAHRFEVGVFEPATSLALLSEVVGDGRVRAEQQAASELAVSCGHLPLALRIAGAKLAVRPHWCIAQMVRRLRSERQRLDELTLDGAGVRASLAMSYQTLGPQPARLLLLLSMLGATDFAGWVVSPLLADDAGDGADPLDNLVDARLVEAQVGAGYRARYRLHDLTRIFARELLATELPAAERAEAQHRLLRCWLFLASQAHRREYGGDFTVLHSHAAHWPLPRELVDELMVDPIEWLHSEHENLVSAIGLAAKLNLSELCWDLAVTSATLFEARSHRQAWHDTHELAMDVARRAGDRHGEAALRYSRGGLALMEKRLADAQRDLEPALAWYAQIRDPHGHGLVAADLAIVDRLQGRYDLALARSEAALAELRVVGDRVGEAHLLRNLAQIRHELGQQEAAEAQLREALTICASVGSRRVEAQIQHALGEVFLKQGKLSDAEATFTAALRTVVDVDDPGGKAYALLGLGTVHLARAELAQAGTAFRDALRAARRAGNRLGQGRILMEMARLAYQFGDLETATATLADAAALFQEVGAPVWLERANELGSRPPGGVALEGVAGRPAGRSR